VSLMPLWGSIMPKSADMAAGHMETWVPRNSNTLSVDYTMTNRDNRAMAKGFSTSWKGAGIFKSAPSLSSPRWKDNAFSQKPGVTGTLWHRENMAPYPICPGAGEPFRPVDVWETSKRLKNNKVDSLLPAAGVGGTYATTPRGDPNHTPRSPYCWPQMAPRTVPGVGRAMGGVLGFPASPNPRITTEMNQTPKTPRFNLTRGIAGNIISSASHPIAGEWTTAGQDELPALSPRTPKTRHDTLWLQSKMAHSSCC